MPDHESADDRALRGAKTVLRKAVGRRREARPSSQREVDDRHRFERLADHLQRQPVGTVACYLSVPPEPGTLQLIAWLAAQRATVLLPVLPTSGAVVDALPDWSVFSGSDDLATGRWGYLQPTGPRVGARTLAEAELIIVPGLAANSRGDRLGRGGGWYDRALVHADARTPVLILLNDDEVLAAIPAQPWDVAVDAILTPTRWIDCQPSD